MNRLQARYTGGPINTVADQRNSDIFSLNGEYGRAAELFDKIDSFKKAAENYSRAERYNEGASVLGRGELFDNLVYYLNE